MEEKKYQHGTKNASGEEKLSMDFHIEAGT